MKLEYLKKLGRISRIPDGWELTTVGKVCKVRNDLRKPISVEERAVMQGPYPYYGPTGLLDHINEYLVDGEFALIGEDGDHFLKPQEKPQTLLLSGKFNVNNHAHLIQTTERCSAKWFYLYFHHRDITNFLSRQGANRYKLNKETLLRLPILVPPYEEQLEVYEINKNWTEAIDITEQLIQAKERQMRGWVQKRISKKCDSWPHVRPDELFETISEKNFPDEELLSVTQDRGVIPRRLLEGRVMSPEGSTANYKLIRKGDFAISLRSFQGGLEYSDYQGIISPAYTVLRPKVDLDSDYYRLFFKSYIFIEKYLNLAVIGIRDGKQISIPDFMSIKIPVPPMTEQHQIAKELLVAQEEINLLKQLAEKYRVQKRGLLQKLLKGIWRVQADKEVA